ncbi:cytochrome P450 [Hygrophoropsis aurantiaca]|uniref:Cytochrome P450 n=1 Tax=Hygrophoropsis aurantiaca TaxID=72124 RepID=A0ACB8A8P0_9AGAM|nr:cytochrome P450 [Hygrophoropsis aurantiaca]
MPWSLSTHFALLLPISIAAIAFADNLRRKKGASLPLPPGPKPLPFIGSVLAIDSNKPWETYSKWGELYGSIIYARFLNQDVIIVNSEKIAKDLMERRSKIYSDRPFIATVEPFGWSFNFALSPYGDLWRTCRRFIHQTFRPESSLNFRPMQLEKAHQLLVNLLQTPEDCFAHVSTYTAAIGMSSVYDYDVLPRNDPMVETINKALFLGIRVMTPERSMLLGALPFLARLPSWLPGATISRDAELSRRYVADMIEQPLKYLQDNIYQSDPSLQTLTLANSCLTSQILQKGQHTETDGSEKFDEALRLSTSTAFAAAAETTSSVIRFFILAMVLDPSIQERAYAQIKSVTGTERMPNFEDRDSLPYIDGIVRESMRWQPIFPMGVVHATTSDDIYDGCFIPKGAMIFPNVWAMAHDESIFPNASEFKPERWLRSDGQLTDAEPPIFTFGFGRRICPGRHLADASIWAAIIYCLTTFQFGKVKDAHGKDIDFVPTYTSGVARQPERFPLRIIPRIPDLDVDKLSQLVRAGE